MPVSALRFVTMNCDDELDRVGDVLLRGHRDVQRLAVELDVLQVHAATRVRIALLHRRKQRGGRERVGADHVVRLSERARLLRLRAGIEVTVVVRDGVEERLSGLGACGVDRVPEAVVVESVVGQEPHGRKVRAVVAHLEEAHVRIVDQVLRHRVVVAPVRMVEEAEVRRIAERLREGGHLVARVAGDTGVAPVARHLLDQAGLLDSGDRGVEVDVVHVHVARRGAAPRDLHPAHD